MKVIKRYNGKDAHVICSHKDALYISERFAKISYPVAKQFCEYMLENHLIVGIVSVYDEQINWYGAHFYVGGKSDKYEDRADLSINGYRLSDKELREFMEGKRLKKWYSKESLKYEEAE